MIDIKEYHYEPNEYAEARNCKPDLTISNELEQCNIVETMIKNAKDTEEYIQDIGGILAEGCPAGIDREITLQHQFIRMMDDSYFHLDPCYKKLVKDAYKEFSVNSLHILKSLERKLSGEQTWQEI